MTTGGFRQNRKPAPLGETARQGTVRLEDEAALLAVARADIEHGRVIADSDVDAWLAAWEKGDAVTLPEASAR